MELQPTPLEQFMRLPAVSKVLGGVSKSFIYAAIQRQGFPAPIRIGADSECGPSVWRATDIAQWQAQRVAAAAARANEIRASERHDGIAVDPHSAPQQHDKKDRPHGNKSR